jgi:hypothetical protein
MVSRVPTLLSSDYLILEKPTHQAALNLAPRTMNFTLDGRFTEAAMNDISNHSAARTSARINGLDDVVSTYTPPDSPV